MTNAPADSPTPALLSDEQIAEIRADIEAGPYRYCTLENANRLLDHALAASAALATLQAGNDDLRASLHSQHLAYQDTIARQAAEIAWVKGVLETITAQVDSNLTEGAVRHNVRELARAARAGGGGT